MKSTRRRFTTGNWLRNCIRTGSGTTISGASPTGWNMRSTHRIPDRFLMRNATVLRCSRKVKPCVCCPGQAVRERTMSWRSWTAARIMTAATSPRRRNTAAAARSIRIFIRRNGICAPSMRRPRHGCTDANAYCVKPLPRPTGVLRRNCCAGLPPGRSCRESISSFRTRFTMFSAEQRKFLLRRNCCICRESGN